MESSFTDSNGVLWNVREDGADDVTLVHERHPPGTTWLRFESELEVRRLWHYPDDWRGLSPIQMESLLDRASTVIARFRPAPHRASQGNRRLVTPATTGVRVSPSVAAGHAARESHEPAADARTSRIQRSIGLVGVAGRESGGGNGDVAPVLRSRTDDVPSVALAFRETTPSSDS